MTIDEAIIHAREVAECREDMCEECRQEHEQLADWLEELKELRSKNAELHDELISLDAYRLGKNYGYNKAIDEFVEMTKKANIDNYNYPSSCISTIEKLLKAGGENECMDKSRR